MTVGEKIQEVRVRFGLTQEQFAERLEVSRQAVSKWELGQAMPDVSNIVRISELFEVSTDELLLRKGDAAEQVPNPLHLGSVYLMVRDFERSVAFYERFLGQSCGGRCPSGNRFVEFYIDKKCLALMNAEQRPENQLPTGQGYKFVQNYWVEDLRREHARVRELGIGAVSDLQEAYPGYCYFHLRDPDDNVIEVTGGMGEEA